MFTFRQILTGVGFTSVAVVAVANGWIPGNPVGATGAREPSEMSAEPPTQSPKQPPVTRQADPNEKVTNQEAAQLLALSPVLVAPVWTPSFEQTLRANKGSSERHLSWTQIDLLDEIARSLPDLASEWLTIECEDDTESRSFANEILQVFALSGGIQATGVKTARPVERGVAVTIASQTDPHFIYAQLIARALNAPETPVHFGPPKDPRHDRGQAGNVQIMILPAE